MLNILFNLYLVLSILRTGYSYYEWRIKDGPGIRTFINSLIYGFFGWFFELYFLFKEGNEMSETKDIQKALHMEVKQYKDPESRLIICIKKNIKIDDGTTVKLDNGHFGLIAAHSTGIAFNSWDNTYINPNIWFPEYPNLIFTEKHTAKDFDDWRTYSFRKLLLQIDSDKEFEMIKNKLIKDEIPFRICGEVAFGSAEVALVIFPLTKDNTPKYLKFLKMYK